MIKKYLNCLKESFFSVIPIAIIVLIISIFIKIQPNDIYSFAISSFLLVIGISLFTFGADLSMVTIGEKIGDKLIQSRKLWYVLIVGLLIGIAITVAEPDLMVLAKQVTTIPNFLFIILVSLGVGIFLMIAIFRIIKNIPLNLILFISYFIIFILLIFCPNNFINIAFDSGGVTTGPMSVPFIVALGFGLTKLRNDKDAKSDTFGIIGLGSTGPIIIVLALSFFFKTDGVYNIERFYNNTPISNQFFNSFKDNILDVVGALLPILLIFVAFQLVKKIVNKIELKKVIFGLFCTFLGLTIFLTGVNVGFIKMGFSLGNIISGSNFQYLLLPLGMILGYIIILVEPAVKVLNDQISHLTQGSISKKMVNFCLSSGVCLGTGISILKIFYDIPFVYVIVPCYVIAVLLSFISPKIFTAIAFDSGGAASGPLTSSFLLPICIGACIALKRDILTNAFGIVALISVFPLITVQILGIIYQYHLNKKDSVNSLNEEIVDFAWEV